MATERLSSILNQLRPTASAVSPNSGGSGVSTITQKSPDDVVITLALRTPLAKAGKGGFKDTDLDYMVFALLKEVVARSKLDPALIEDVCLGNVRDDKAAYILRAAALAAGIPHTAGASSVNRFCSSGLKAVHDIANQIRLGAIDVGLAMGAESMSAADYGRPLSFHEEIMKAQEARDCLQPMGQTSENVGDDFNISRQMQDQFAAESFRRAEVAQKAGWFNDEIVPITTTVKDPKTGDWRTVTLTKDEGIRYGTTVEALGKIRPAFPQFGNKTTGGNASQVTDGAAAVLLMRRSKAIELNQPILGKFCGATVAGVAPRIMGIGPSIAIPKLLSQFNLHKADIDIFEINEAFASMAVYCVNTLGLDAEKVNPCGGAIALGHPLGTTGARQICTILSEARRTKKKVLITSMCIGTGQGMAGLLVNEQV
jgi:acetyl-CoA acetyltransferase family protein